MAAPDENAAPFTFERAVEILRWWREAGVDQSLDEIPHNRFAEFVAQPTPLRAAPRKLTEAERGNEAPARLERAAAARPVAATGVDEAVRSAGEIAAAAGNLEALREALDRFDGCALKATATRLVFSDGAPYSPIMLIGEAPGGEEDRIGRPFVGRAGQLLDRMLDSIRLNRSQVYIANCVPWRPPGNRTPTPQEAQICLPFIRRQIELSNPRLIVCLGASALSTLLGGRDGISRARGQWRSYEAAERSSIPALPMFHPAYLLRQPNAKRWAWADLRKLRKAIAAGYRPV